AAPKIEIRRSSDPGLEIDHLFVSRAFNTFQAGACSKTLMTFATAPDAAACITLAGADGIWSNPITGAFGGAAVVDPSCEAAIPGLVASLTGWLRGEGRAAA